MRTPTSTWKIIGVLAAALATGGGGTVGYSVLQARQEATAQALAELRQRHESDIACVRTLLDSLLVTSTRNSATLDMLVQLLRDHAGAEQR
jgi:type II secretory pathway pseudopilin PulG